VRHGADPGEALAEVLGVAAEDIRVRERAEQTIPWRCLIRSCPSRRPRWTARWVDLHRSQSELRSRAASGHS